MPWVWLLKGGHRYDSNAPLAPKGGLPQSPGWHVRPACPAGMPRGCKYPQPKKERPPKKNTHTSRPVGLLITHHFQNLNGPIQ